MTLISTLLPALWISGQAGIDVDIGGDQRFDQRRSAVNVR